VIGAYGTLILVLGASLLIGQALAVLAAGGGREARAPVSPIAPAYGIAALLVLGGASVRLPGHAITAAVLLAIATIAAAAYIPGRVEGLRAALTTMAPVIAVTVLAASLPFALAGHVGILGVGLVNDDMASHLIIADYLTDPSGPVPSFVKGGYPIGPHAIVAAIGKVGGAGLVDVWAGFTLALAPLLGLVGLGLLDDLPRARRVVGACLISLSYLGASYLFQGAFKEPLQALLLIGVAACLAGLVGSERKATALDGPPVLRVLPLAVLVAATFFNYSLPGLLWVGAVAVAVVGARYLLVSPRPVLPDDWLRKLAPYAIGVVVVVALATVQEWSRIADFSRLSALNPDRFGSQLGNLKGSLSPLEALGIWPSGDFRVSASAAGAPAVVFYAGALIAAVAVGLGLVRGIRDGRLFLPAAAIATAGVWVLLALVGSPYIAAKALAIAAPLLMALALRGTLGARGPALALGIALVLAGGLSTFLVLRQAPVGPDAHANELEQIRGEVAGHDVLFLGRDDFIGWELRGSGEITGVVTNFYDVEDSRPRFKKGKGGGEKFDVDAVYPKTLDDFRYVLATRGGPASSVPPRFDTVMETRDYVLYERTGATGRRKTLDEGTDPGTELKCGHVGGAQIAHGGGSAIVWDPEPVIDDADRWAPSDEPTDGAPVSQELVIPQAGRWQISLAYDSRRPLHVTAPDLGLDTTVAANLDFRGATPTFPVGDVDVDGPTKADVTVEPEEPNLLARLLRAPNEAHLRSLTATPLDPGAIKRVPLAGACGSYVDWYRSG
jgi:hypothetical protein